MTCPECDLSGPEAEVRYLRSELVRKNLLIGKLVSALIGITDEMLEPTVNEALSVRVTSLITQASGALEDYYR